MQFAFTQKSLRSAVTPDQGSLGPNQGSGLLTGLHQPVTHRKHSKNSSAALHMPALFGLAKHFRLWPQLWRCGALKVQCLGFSGIWWWGGRLQPTEDTFAHRSVSKRVKDYDGLRKCLELVFGLFALGYCRNMAGQDGGLRGKGTLYANMKGSLNLQLPNEVWMKMNQACELTYKNCTIM